MNQDSPRNGSCQDRYGEMSLDSAVAAENADMLKRISKQHKSQKGRAGQIEDKLSLKISSV